MKAFVNKQRLASFKSSPNILITFKREARTLKKGQDPVKAAETPVYEYASENKLKLEDRLYIWGFAATGALGKAIYVKPTPPYRPKEFIKTPRRFSFFYGAKVLDISCGTGFTAIAVHSSQVSHKLFGTGINTDFQIGYHSPRLNHPLKLLAQPVPIHLPLCSSEKVVQVACGRAHTVCLTSSNTGTSINAYSNGQLIFFIYLQVLSLGCNAFGQCGREFVENEQGFKVNKINFTDRKITKVSIFLNCT